jgi:beta-glucanase (GH16 family)
VFEFSKESADPTKWPFDTPQYLILNLAIGGDWGGQKGIDDAIFPAKFLVDYVRVYQKTK